jgi:hypothetical protein
MVHNYIEDLSVKIQKRNTFHPDWQTQLSLICSESSITTYRRKHKQKSRTTGNNEKNILKRQQINRNLNKREVKRNNK